MVIAAMSFAQKDIVDTAVESGKFTTLVKLVQAAGLVDTLKSAGPFTVFAPTDAAFKKLPKKLVNKLMHDPELLKKVLLYHVVSGAVSSADARKLAGQSVATANGANVHINVHGSYLLINKSRVIIADVRAANGVIHAIDTVLMPPSH